MDTSFLNTLSDKANEVGAFLFGSFEGIAILIGSVLLLSLVIAVILEFRTRKKYKDYGPKDSEDEAANA